MLIPILTVARSAWLNDEPIGAALALGGLLVLAGVYVRAVRPPPLGPAPAETAPVDLPDPLAAEGSPRLRLGAAGGAGGAGGA